MDDDMIMFQVVPSCSKFSKVNLMKPWMKRSGLRRIPPSWTCRRSAASSRNMTRRCGSNTITPPKPWASWLARWWLGVKTTKIYKNHVCLFFLVDHMFMHLFLYFLVGHFGPFCIFPSLAFMNRRRYARRQDVWVRCLIFLFFSPLFVAVCIVGLQITLVLWLHFLGSLHCGFGSWLSASDRISFLGCKRLTTYYFSIGFECFYSQLMWKAQSFSQHFPGESRFRGSGATFGKFREQDRIGPGHHRQDLVGKDDHGGRLGCPDLPLAAKQFRHMVTWTETKRNPLNWNNCWVEKNLKLKIWSRKAPTNLKLNICSNCGVQFVFPRQGWLPDDTTCFPKFGLYNEITEQFVDNRENKEGIRCNFFRDKQNNKIFKMMRNLRTVVTIFIVDDCSPDFGSTKTPELES